jgi:acyl-CoA thioesterase YciA
MMIDMTHTNSFVVMPTHTNYMYPLIFGGAFMSELDLCAATLVNKLVKKSTTIDNAVTHKADFTFHAPSYAGDVIYMDATVSELGKKSIVVKVEAYREPRDSESRIHVATSHFVFVTRMGESYKHHKLEL